MSLLTTVNSSPFSRTKLSEKAILQQLYLSLTMTMLKTFQKAVTIAIMIARNDEVDRLFKSETNNNNDR